MRSRYFLQYPTFPLKDLKLLIRLDCLGRCISELDFRHNPELFGGKKIILEAAQKMELIWILAKYHILKNLTEVKCRTFRFLYALKFLVKYNKLMPQPEEKKLEPHERQTDILAFLPDSSRT